jgi:predicted phosphodiesterase
MRLGVLADIHGNETALRAVLDDAAGCRVDRWWVLGDLVLMGPRPAEVLGLLQELPSAQLLRGNTDRYVPTGEQPAPHATATDAMGDLDLVERYGLMAAGIGWTRGVLDQAGLLDGLDHLPGQLRLAGPGGLRVLGVHASPGADDGPGIEPALPGGLLGQLLAGCAADVVIGGHTHAATDRMAGAVRALNPGSTGLPRRPGVASWLILELNGGPGRPGGTGPGAAADVAVEHRTVPYDAAAVARDLRARRHPNAEFLEQIHTAKRPQYPSSAL